MTVPGGSTSPFQAASVPSPSGAPAPGTGDVPGAGGASSPSTGGAAGGSGGPPPPKQSWSRPDRINGIGVIVAIIGLVAGVGIPRIIQFCHYLHRPQASITYPRNGQHFAVNLVPISGSAKHVPPNDVLWVTASGASEELYPITNLNLILHGVKWNIPASQASCLIGPGQQQIVVWLGPDTSEAPFVKFLQSSEHTQGLLSVPLGFEKLSQVNIYVRKAPDC